MIFDFKSDIYCEGIIGDGCGGGRFFIVENTYLIAYEPYTKDKITLLTDIKHAKSISKKGCTITIECQDKTINLDLSTIKN